MIENKMKVITAHASGTRQISSQDAQLRNKSEQLRRIAADLQAQIARANRKDTHR